MTSNETFKAKGQRTYSNSLCVKLCVGMIFACISNHKESMFHLSVCVQIDLELKGDIDPLNCEIHFDLAL
jgi:hypothetical protein